ncbi:hypothetical protein PoB_003214900 [Plakobranchus ocellatus]|uniref:Reverse transcriptase domain-containing protein n=1 Tax=Plakobranchus ocellatus TaxID=259542 RepID=A0AAV4ADC3_9GAST|nr:hypothetical protein PoB_003214900 [Plakobranchus ocellatus]
MIRSKLSQASSFMLLNLVLTFTSPYATFVSQNFLYDEDKDNLLYIPPPPYLRKDSSFTPNAGRDPALDTFITAIFRDLMTCQPRRFFSNLRTEEKRAKTELRNNTDITIKPSDKVRVLNTIDYVAERNRTAMGIRMPPSYANILMGTLERRLLDTWPDKSMVWPRYIDDIFFIWTHGRSKHEQFINHANTFYSTIKLTSTISPTQIPFLDIMICFHNGLRQIDLYSKPTDTFNHLHWTSCYPYHTRCSIPVSLAFRLVRICSTDGALKHRLTQLSTHRRPVDSIPKQYKWQLIKLKGFLDNQCYKNTTGHINTSTEFRSLSHTTQRSTNNNIPSTLKKIIFPNSPYIRSLQKSAAPDSHVNLPQTPQP